VSDAEYAALRGELGFWQNLRLGVLGFDLALLGGVLASELLTTRSPFAVPALMTFVLFLSALMIWHGARGSICIGTYLQVFYEEPSAHPGWEARLRNPILRPVHHALGILQYSRLLSAAMFMIFLASLFPVVRTFRSVEDVQQLLVPWGVGQAVAPASEPASEPKPEPQQPPAAGKADPTEKGWSPERYDLVLAAATVVLFACFLAALVAITRMTNGASRQRYLTAWRAIRQSEQHKILPGHFRLNEDRFEYRPPNPPVSP